MDSLTPLDEDADNEDSPDYLEPDYLACLNVRQRRFVEEITKNRRSATQAAIKAGYSQNPTSAWTIASRLLRNVKVSNAIDKILEESTLSTKQILAKLSQKAESSIEPFVQSLGRSLLMDFDTPKARAALHTIKKFKAGRYGPEIELHDPIKAMLTLEQIRNKVGKDDDPAKGSNKPKVTLYMPDNGRRKPPGYVPPAPLPEVKPD